MNWKMKVIQMTVMFFRSLPLDLVHTHCLYLIHTHYNYKFFISLVKEVSSSTSSFDVVEFSM